MKLPRIESRATDIIIVVTLGIILFAGLASFNGAVDTPAELATLSLMLTATCGLFVFRDLRWVFLQGWTYGPTRLSSHILRLPISVTGVASGVAAASIAFVVEDTVVFVVLGINLLAVAVCIFWQPFNRLEKNGYEWRRLD